MSYLKAPSLKQHVHVKNLEKEENSRASEQLKIDDYREQYKVKLLELLKQFDISFEECPFPHPTILGDVVLFDGKSVGDRYILRLYVSKYDNEIIMRGVIKNANFRDTMNSLHHQYLATAIDAVDYICDLMDNKSYTIREMKQTYTA